MKAYDLQEILRKAEELRIVPFLDEIVSFVRDINPILVQINSSLSDNVKKMPSATQKLSKVTEATETATNEIMNIIDALFTKIDSLGASFIQWQNLDELLAGISDELEKALLCKGKLSSDKIVKSCMEQLASCRQISSLSAEASGLASEIGEDLNNIMISLQVQDITSQQIAAVNHLLTTIQLRLVGLLSHFQTEELRELLAQAASFDEEEKVSSLHRDIAFDPDAVCAITEKKDRQVEVDEILLQAQATGLELLEEVAEKQSTDEETEILSDLFGDLNSPEKQESAFSADVGFSQEDIDALFGSASDDEESEGNGKISQDDIDALFD